MLPFSFIGIFCEDIREEVGGRYSMIGVLPDNVGIGGLPGMIPKLGVYVRIHLYKEANPKTLKARIKLPDGTTHGIADFAELIESAKRKAESDNVLFAGFIAKGLVSPLPITQVGRIEVIVEMDGTEYICGVLNLIQPEVAGMGGPQ